MRRSSVPCCLLAFSLCFALVSPVLGQIAPPAPGVELPRSYFEVLERHPDAFHFRHAWIEKTQRAKETREILQDAGMLLGKAPAAGTSVSGNYAIPVFTVSFSNTGSDPYPTLDLQQALFGGGAATQTLSAFYDEISNGLLNVSGTVMGWDALPNVDTYYEGTSNGTDPSNARLGELIQHALDSYDGTLDFGQYDNDGPDGIPNSGDDDGYVDFVAFVHPESGGECGNDNIWSHRWVYRAWGASGGQPYQTNDNRSGGGKILVDDYVVQPAYSCNGTNMIEIGVFCHEFGHAFGLPDLYDTNGGSAGVGHWCLMASGSWNDPDSPAHMSAWCKQELGWASTVEIGWQGAPLSLAPVATSHQVYELSFSDDRWRRRSECVLQGSWSLVMGLDAAESAARNWATSGGYGNGWRETVAHDFHYDGVGPVNLSYRYAVDSEGGYDYAFVLLEVGGSEHVLAVHDGVTAGSANHDLTSDLGGSATDYRVKFRFASDNYYSNEDGNYASSCAPFVVDDIVVSGGGESHVADFETHLGGWYQPDVVNDNPRSEAWLVENRQQLGFDVNLHGEGLLIYHVDQEIMDTGNSNTGGSSNVMARGVVVEEADGLFELLTSDGGRGNAGDPWPGSTGNTSFDAVSSPASVSNSGNPTEVVVSGIVPVGDDVQCTLVAGDPAPSLAGVQPASASVDDGLVALELLGEDDLRHGAQLRLVRAGEPDLVASDVEWLDYDRLSGVVDLSAAASGLYDVVVENPDGQTASLIEGFEITPGAVAAPETPLAPRSFDLGQNYPNPFNPSTTIRFAVPARGKVTLAVFDLRGRRVRTLLDATLDADWYQESWDGRDAEGRSVASGLYFYRLVGEDFVQQKKMMLVR